MAPVVVGLPTANVVGMVGMLEVVWHRLWSKKVLASLAQSHVQVSWQDENVSHGISPSPFFSRMGIVGSVGVGLWVL